MPRSGIKDCGQINPFLPPLAAAQPSTILSRLEALYASGSRRACRMAKALPVFRGVGWPRVNLTPGVTYSCGREPASPDPWAKCLLRNELRRRPDCNPPKPRMSRGQKPQCLSSLCVSRAVRFAARSGDVPSSRPRWTAIKTHTCLVSASLGQRPMRESKGTERTGWLSPLLMKLTRELYDGTPNAGYSTLSTGV